MDLMTLELPDDLSISQVEEYKHQVITQIENFNKVTINDKCIVKIDTVGVQLLLALIHYFLLKGVEIEWQINSSILIESIKQLGLEHSELGNYLKK